MLGVVHRDALPAHFRSASLPKVSKPISAHKIMAKPSTRPMRTRSLVFSFAARGVSNANAESSLDVTGLTLAPYPHLANALDLGDSGQRSNDRYDSRASTRARSFSIASRIAEHRARSSVRSSTPGSPTTSM